ncbi:MAG: UDP-4-amino-4,6-dideoxy-N-acetyl-beta-L-altrosamine transaminase [Candidatus Aenigmarchaeota archaeon]|nr:UDP-4-amino-4,6-dideoxy-N-acetyl-beta-L-altrosamine transaminase [Candidatus Aenigmarchaeota archaeon]
MRKTFLPYTMHDISDADAEEIMHVLKQGWLTTGPKIEEFENAIKDFIGCKFAVAVSSATAGLDIAVQVLDLPAGSEIITTPFTFVASSNCALYNNCTPVFADIDGKTYNIDPDKIEEKITDKTKAILPVHYAGQPCDMEAIKKIAREHNLAVIEDAAHAIGAEYKGRKIGTIGDLTVFSFHAAKNIVTGEGGIVTTDSEELYKKLLLLRSHGIDKSTLQRYGAAAGYEYDMKILARNYRITDIQCAIGLTQLRRFDEFLARRNEIVKIYNRELSQMKEIAIPFVSDNVKHAWHIYTMLLNGINRDSFFKEMKRQNIGVNVHYIPVYRHSYYRERFGIKPEEFPVTEGVFKRIVTLPLFPKMTDEDVNDVIDAAKETVEKLRD